MEVAVLFGSFALFLLLTIPIGVAIGLSALVTILVSGSVPVAFLMKEMITALDSFPLLAVPLFILAGEIMGRGGISERIFRFANALVGNKTGGFAIATVLTCMFFSAISGSAPATVAAIGIVMIPAMVNSGYDKRFAAAIVASAGSIGVILPPSIPMIMFGVTGSVSIGDLFLAGIIPGILVGLALMIWAYIYSRKKGYKGSKEPTSIKKIIKTLWDAKWAMLMPIIILGGIYSGFFTPTESAVIAVVFGLIVSLFVYKELSIKDLPKIFSDSALTTGVVLVIVGTATAFGRILTIGQIPGQIASALMAISEDRIIVMLLIALFLLVIGCFMDTTAAIIILTPVLLPVAENLGYDPVHFGIIMVVNLAIGFITPPLGLNLFVASGITGYSIGVLSKAVVPFLIAMIITLVVIILVPQISLLLVN